MFAAVRDGRTCRHLHLTPSFPFVIVGKTFLGSRQGMSIGKQTLELGEAIANLRFALRQDFRYL
jgi:hypothetical protein